MSDFASSLPIRTENNGDVVSKLVDFTTPTQGLAIDAAGLLGAKLYDSTGTGISSQANGGQQALDVGVCVGGTQVDPRDIRALVNTDVVTSEQGAKNASHAQAWWTQLTDGTNDSVLLGTGELTVAVTQPLPAGTNLIGDVNSRTQDGSGTAIDSQALGGSQWLDIVSPSNGATGSAVPAYATFVAGTDGTNLRGIKTDSNGVVQVAISNVQPGTEVNDYNTGSAVAANATSNHDYTITSGKTIRCKKFWASASGKLKAEVQVSTDGTTFVTKWVGFNSTSNPNITIDLNLLTLSDTGTGAKVRIIRTNLDLQAMDVYSTISGEEE